MCRPKVALAFVFLALNVAGAQGKPSAATRVWGIFGGLDLVTVRFEPAVNERQGVGSRGWGISFNVGASVKDFLLLGADFGVLGLHDDSSFTNSTTGGQRTSSTSVLFFSPFAGLRSPAIGAAGPRSVVTWLGVLVGEGLWSGDRSIANCVNCDEESLKITGGPFVEPFIVIGKRSSVAGLKVSYRVFTADDASVKNAIFVGFYAKKSF